MADTISSFVLENLAHLATDEVELLRSTKEEVNKLTDTLADIQASLHDAEMKQFQNKDVQEWLSKLKYMEYEVDDVLDEWKVKSHLLSTNNPVWNFFTQCTCFQQLFLHHNIGKKMKNINKKLDQIVIDKNRFGFQQNTTGFEVGSSRMTSSCVDTSEVFGREDEKNKIINMLLKEGSSESSGIPVISIVGMGGYGKTTLAKLVFNEDELKSHFKELIWVCVSDEFDVAKIIKMIIEAIKEKPPAAIGLEALFKFLQDKLKDKRFLLVLDDVWNENFGKWEDLENILKKCGANGSKIVITTRHERVAQVMHSSYIHKLDALCFEDCWSIFRKIVFQGVHESEVLELINIGRKIVTKCKGTALAIKTVAGALRTARTRSHWENALNDEIWNQPEEGILPALMLSYYHLSPQLKRCFRYFSIFPKDEEIEKEKLVRMWVAQGYIPPEENKEMEDTGKEYFEELLRRSLLQEPEGDDFGNITYCKMHDLVHDLAQFVTNGESTFIDGSKDNSMFNSRKLRHCIWIAKRFDQQNLTALKNLRTLEVIPSDVLGDNSYNLFEQLQCIRVLSLHERGILKFLKSIGKLVHLRYLDLSWTEIEALPESIGIPWNLRYLNLRHTQLKKIPKSIGKLGQLRYLNLEWTRIEELPESITDLHHMQLLNLNYCQRLYKLPGGIQKMTSLKRLGIEGTRALEALPAGIGKLSSLEKLDRFILTEGEGECKLSDLRDLNHLQGSLSIENLEAGSIDEAVNARLVYKSSLRELKLRWSERGELRPSRAEGVLETLRPHHSLQELKIYKYQGSKFPSWIGESSFSGLVTVTLWDVPNCTELPALGNLPQLRNLYIESMPEVRRVGSEFFGSKNGFPKLESLTILELEKWEEWDSSLLTTTTGGGGGGVGGMPCLRELVICVCPKLKALPPIFSEELRKVSIRELKELSGWEWIPPSVEDIYIFSCPGEFISKLPSLPKLESLKISQVTTELSCDRLQFTGLKTLDIYGCTGLKSLPEEFMNSLKGLQKLFISGCENLKVLPSIASEALKEVHILNCPNLSEVGSIPPITEIMGLQSKLLSKVPSLPMLNRLEIEDDDEVMDLSNNLIRFTELQTLIIRRCPNLRSLPEEMRSLKKLRELEIEDCPNLKESCKRGGEQWSKIAHIPRIEIDYKRIQDHA